MAPAPLAEAESGFISLNGAPDGAPTRCATYLCDDLAGLHGSLSAVAALRHRDLTGEGQHIDIALLDAVLFPHVREREMMQETEQEDGQCAPITGPAAKFSRTPIRVRQRAVALGEHSDQILAELGFDATARGRLRSMKVI